MSGARALGLVAALAIAACGAGADGDRGGPGAGALEARLMAPCCWVGTLDGHQSALASALREEIGQRLARDEPAASIEDDLALRYGERIRAVPKGSDPRGGLMLGAGLGVAVALAALVATLRRWTARSPAVSSAGTPAAAFTPNARDAYDDRIDDDLARLDG
jgi:cytochrome c-type biogenesis protein CcmH